MDFVHHAICELHISLAEPLINLDVTPISPQKSGIGVFVIDGSSLRECVPAAAQRFGPATEHREADDFGGQLRSGSLRTGIHYFAAK
ncbi:MAG TPA: hypothetical protein VEK11_00675 [Thermoanaerobaculia bacterium]|nr:hypothetical protein [Thermoanaerobaculia bacterium]